MSAKTIPLTLTSAIAVEGEIVGPGKDKSKADVSVAPEVARNLVRRGKAKLFGDAVLEGVDTDADGAGVDLGEKEGFPPSGKDADKRSGSPLSNGSRDPSKSAAATPGKGSGPAPKKADAKKADAKKAES